MTTEKQFQTYTSSRDSVRLITPSGKHITFVGFSFYTDDPEIITFLDYEIKQGLPGITRGEIKTTTELDPMASLKKRIIAEFLEEQKKGPKELQLGDTREGGLKTTTTKQVAN